jgi:hypothetical protein
MDPELSKRNPAMIRRGVDATVDATAAGVTLDTCGTLISNVPKIRLLFVRRLISGLIISGIDVFERIPSFIVVSLVESILFLSRCLRDIEMY